MTNTDTADADGTALQVARLAHAGSQLVRVTVNTDQAAAAVPEMIRKLRDDLGVDVPVIGDFHYNGHQLLVEYPGDGARRSRSTGSTRATSARSATTRTSRRSSGSPSTTTSRCASASTGARSISSS